MDDLDNNTIYSKNFRNNVLYPKNCFHLFNPGKNLNKNFLVW